MLDGYWLFCEPNSSISRDSARLDEFISLFKHACLFQREINLSDLMVVGSPNFRRAYRIDAQFRNLVLSDLVNVFYLHRKGARHDAEAMDLIDVKNFHIKYKLIYEEDQRYYEPGGSDAFLHEIQGKSPSTLREAQGSQRDPNFTRRVMAALHCTYLENRLGLHRALFEECTREVHLRLATTHTPLGAIHFEEGRNEDGTYRWKEPTVMDLLFNRLGDTLSRDERRAINETVWRFYRAHLFRAESDLLQVDPVVPPEIQFYVEVLHGRTPESLFETSADGDFRTFALSTDLDDVRLYRHLDCKTILAIRDLGEPFFNKCAVIPELPGLTAEQRKRHDERHATQFQAALTEYLHRTVRELTQRFTELRQPSLDRKLLIRMGTLIDEQTMDEEGRPKPIVTTVVHSAIGHALGPLQPDLRMELGVHLNPLSIYLTNFLAPVTWRADAHVARAAYDVANQLRVAGLVGPEEPRRIQARAVTPAGMTSGGGFTAYKAVPKSGA